MRILAIETSGRHGSAAILESIGEDARLVQQIVLTREQRTAQALAPALRELLAGASWPPQSVELVSVTCGPGSFTGLRIGVTTAKTFAYAAGAQVLGVNTLVALAAQAPPASAPLWTVFDAQRQELFAALFDDLDRERLLADCEYSIVANDKWLEALQPGEHVIGPALRRLASRLPAGVVAAPEELWQPMAAAVAHIAWRAYQAGKRDDVWKLAPNYGRPSYAEEKAHKLPTTNSSRGAGHASCVVPDRRAGDA